MRRFVAIQHVRQSRGSTWIQFIVNIGVIVANIRLFQDTLMYYTGISHGDLIYVYIAAAVMYFIVSWGIGYLDEILGIWKKENDYGVTLTPVTSETYLRVKSIDERLEKIERKLDEMR